MRRIPLWLALLLLSACSLPTPSPAQSAHTLSYGPGKSITLSLPDPFDIHIAATGLRRVRFLARAPDGRIFATGMYDLADNTRGSIFILDGWDDSKHAFARVIPYLEHLRNPNNVAFWTDPATHQSWIYVPLTDKLVRYRYSAGDNAPTSRPETLMEFPGYGLSYKYGGWHLTRTVAIAPFRGSARLYVSVGSSCNYCQEKEVLRASIVSMDPDGKNPSIVAQGLRNAVDLRYISSLEGGSLFATNMGADHLGEKLPEDTFFKIDASGAARNYGWPGCYFAQGKPVHDTTSLPSSENAGAIAVHPASSADSVYGKQAGVAASGTNLAAGGGKAPAKDLNGSLGHAPAPLPSCEQVPAAYTTFAAHSSPLGFEYFGQEDASLRDGFLVALHGASRPRIGTGYRVARFTPSDRTPRNFITGFLTVERGRPVVHGRPCGILRTGPDSFLLTDDYLGLVYSIHPKQKPGDK